jgi:cytochrome c-type biogenesis protein CcmH/NrfG
MTPHPPSPRTPPLPPRLQYRARLARMLANLAQDGTERRRLLRDSEAGLRRCLETDPTDPRPYVSLGKILLQQKRYDEARKLYADGTANTGERARRSGAGPSQNPSGAGMVLLGFVLTRYRPHMGAMELY